MNIKSAPKTIWARILRVFTSLGLLRSAYMYWLTPTVGWFILIALLFILLAVVILIIAKSKRLDVVEPIAWLF